jgi:hypothetical protein
MVTQKLPLSTIKVLLMLVFFLVGGYMSQAQQKILLKNAKRGKQKEIREGDRIKIRYITYYERLKVRNYGKVLQITDSALLYRPEGSLFKSKDTIRVALTTIRAIGSYNKGGQLGLAAGIGILGGVTFRC